MNVQQLFGSFFLKKRRHLPVNLCSGDADAVAGADAAHEEWVPATWLRDRYVLLLLHEPSWSLAAPPAPGAAPTPCAGLPPAARHSLLSPRTPRTPGPAPAAGRRPRAATCHALSVLAAYCRSVLRGRTAATAAAAPVAVLEVRMAPHTAVHAEGVCAPASSPLPPADGKDAAESLEFGGWLVLDSAAAFRQVVRAFGVTTWPSVLLFGPNGQLLTSRALDHIVREMATVTVATGDIGFSIDLDASGSVNEGKSAPPTFPWITEDSLNPGDSAGDQSEEDRSGGGAATGAGEEETPSTPPTPESFLWRLLSVARRLHDVVDDDSVRRSTSVKEDKDTAEARMDGAKFLLVCFGSGWHTPTGRFLPLLRCLWSSLRPDGAGKESYVKKVGLHAFPSGSGVMSYQMGTFTERAFGMSVAIEDNAGFASLCGSRESASWSPFFSSSPAEADVRGTAANETEPLGTSLDLPAEPNSMVGELNSETSMSTQQDHKHQEQGLRQPSFQVLYVNCDERESDLLSALGGLPGLWLCVSPCFGHCARSLIEMCREVLDVDLFPRLVVAELLHEDETGEGKKKSAPIRIVNSHAEARVLGDVWGQDFPWNDDAGLSVAPMKERVSAYSERTNETSENDCNDPLCLPFQKPFVLECRTPRSCVRALKSVARTCGALVVLCGVGRIAPELHHTCAMTLREAQVWCAAAVARGGNKVDATLPPIPSNRSTADPETDGAEKVGVPVLPVYFIDAIAKDRAAEAQEDKGERSNGAYEGREECEEDEDEDSDSVWGEQKGLLQEYALAELLEEGEHTFPPVEGEPFLLVALWPERRVAVLRRRLDCEGPPPAPSSNARGFCGRGGCSVFPVCVSPPTAALVPSPVKTTPVVDSASGQSSHSGTLPTESLQNPVCSLPHVKAFLSQHIFGLTL